jgi:ABC-type glycerol-3-phosphate transport system substrate-binding protein
MEKQRDNADSMDRRRFLKLVGGAGAALAMSAADSTAWAESSDKPGKKVSLSFWTISFFNGRTGSEKHGKPEDYYNWQIAQFRKLYPNVSVNVTFVPSTFEGWAKFDTAVAAGNPPDVMWGQAGNQWKYAPTGAIVPFNGHMPAAAIHSFLPALKSMTTYVDGKTYLWPYGIACAGGVFVNTDLAKAAGAQHLVPHSRARDWTTDQFLSLAEATTRGSGASKVYGTALMTDWSYQLNQFLYGFGANIYNANQTAMVANSPQGDRGLKWLVDLEHKSKVAAPGSAGRTNSQVLQMFLRQKIAIYPAQPYYITAFRSAPSFKPNFKWTFVQPPHHPGQHMGAESNVHGYLISKQSDAYKLKMAMEFVKFLTRPQALRILATGQGLVPPVKSMLGAWAGNDPDLYVEGLITKAAKPWGRLYTTIGPNVWTPMYDSAFALQKTPAKALSDAVSAGDVIINQAARRYGWPK